MLVKTINNVGKQVLETFNNKIDDSLFTEMRFNEQISTASKIAENAPFVTWTFREKGILKPSESNIGIIGAFKPNLMAQDMAYETGVLDKMTIHTAQERADSSIEYVMRNHPSISKVLAKSGKTMYDFADAYRESSLIEAAYYTILSGAKLSKSVEERIKTAMMRRLMISQYDFKKITDEAGVTIKDSKALTQFANEIELVDIIKSVVENDPYFNRRKGQINEFKTINSRKSIEEPQKMSEKMADGLLSILIKKYPSLAKRAFSEMI